MAKNTPIEETFRNAFDNFEADVNARVWTNIEQHLATPAAPAASNVAGEAAKTILTGSKFSALTYGIASSIIIAIVAVSYYFLSPANNETPVANVANHVNTPQTKQTDENIKSESLKNLTAESKHENTLNLQKTDKNKTNPVEVNKTSAKPESPNNQNVSKENDGNTPYTQPITTHEQKDVNNDVSTPVQTESESPKENKSATAADEKHKTNNSEDGTNTNEEPKIEKSSQKDDFEWGIIANSFSPNNDGLNDLFSIKTPGLKSLVVIIYDRNGNIVYKWNNLDGSWDGRNLKGKEMPAGFYLYYIFAELPESKFHSKNGTISIFR